MEAWLSLITEIGFPIVVTFYLLHRIEGRMNVLIETIHELPEKMNSLNWIREHEWWRGESSFRYHLFYMISFVDNFDIFK